MHIFSILLFVLSRSIAAATDTSQAIDLVGLTPKGDLIAWHEKGATAAGEFERYVVAKALDLSPTEVFTISDPLSAAMIVSKPQAVKERGRR